MKFFLTIPMCLIMVAYEMACAFDFSISPLNLNGKVAWIFGGGWAPLALVILVHEIWGYLDPNEDRELIRQRRVRGAEIDAEMGYTSKPNWWKRLNSDHNLSVVGAISKNVREVNERRNEVANDRSIELNDMPTSPGHGNGLQSYSDSGSVPNIVRIGASLLFPVASSGVVETTETFSDSGDRGRLVGESGITTTSGTSERSTSVSSGTTLSSPPQKIRSMLDV
jgi:hypothetical protein